MKLYGISGLGADNRVFKYLNISTELIPINWIDPMENESLESYAVRLSKSINQNEDFGILGVSFGGLVAVEISKKLNPKLTILISSVETKTELRKIYRIMGKTGLLKGMPKSVFNPPRLISNWFFGAENKKLLYEILDDTDLSFAKWAVSALVNWKNDERLTNPLLKIGGSKDKLMPPAANDNKVLIDSGAHFMIVDKADEISEMINNKIRLLE